LPRQKGKKEPIRDKNKIREMKEWILINKPYKYYMLFYININIGTRIGDTLRLRKMDVWNKEEIRIVTQKTNREVIIPISNSVQKEINKYTDKMADSDFLFQSREGENKSITPQMAHNILKEAAENCGIQHWGTHSMRKSFGYHYYSKTKDVYFLMRLFGHSSQHQTLDYIGITNDEIRKSLEDFSL
jgi:integrase